MQGFFFFIIIITIAIFKAPKKTLQEQELQ